MAGKLYVNLDADLIISDAMDGIVATSNEDYTVDCLLDVLSEDLKDPEITPGYKECLEELLAMRDNLTVVSKEYLEMIDCQIGSFINYGEA